MGGKVGRGGNGAAVYDDANAASAVFLFLGFRATMTSLPRSAGVLLHPTSLPGPFGIGDLGPEAYRWVEALASARQTWWQILPLGPTGAGNSPYQSFSAFAGNIALLSPELLVRDGLLAREFVCRETFPDTWVDFNRVRPLKQAILREAWNHFRGGRCQPGIGGEFEAYCKRESAWLDDYALFTAIREALGGASLADWPVDVRKRDPKALAALEEKLAAEVMMHRFGQFLFDRQWSELRAFAHQKRVRILGDAPIFVSGDSSDVWANPDQFLLDSHGHPTAVAGVPPDYFSPTGQHWGNPLYDWDRMAATGYSWWVARLRRNLAQVDAIRLDHFRGFAAAWHIPAGEKTAMNGKWVPGPGRKLFDRLAADLGSLPLIAEDLGLITKDVDDLRIGLGLPGMRVLQFMLGTPDNPYWPHNYEPNTVVYTGTHDNDTTNGWYAKLDDSQRWKLGEYLGRPATSPAWELIRLAWSSVAKIAVTPAQDLLDLGGDARMNTPGVPEGNWGWRIAPHTWKPDVIPKLAALTYMYDRDPNVTHSEKG